jgi:hypothetical protein
MEARIHDAEARMTQLSAEAERREVVSDASRLLELHGQMERLRLEIDGLYARWAELEALRA